MKCSKCNKDIKDSNNFCNYCGSKVIKDDGKCIVYCVASLIIIVISIICYGYGSLNVIDQLFTFSWFLGLGAIVLIIITITKYPRRDLPVYILASYIVVSPVIMLFFTMLYCMEVVE